MYSNKIRTNTKYTDFLHSFYRDDLQLHRNVISSPIVPNAAAVNKAEVQVHRVGSAAAAAIADVLDQHERSQDDKLLLDGAAKSALWKLAKTKFAEIFSANESHALRTRLLRDKELGLLSRTLSDTDLLRLHETVKASFEAPHSFPVTRAQSDNNLLRLALINNTNKDLEELETDLQRVSDETLRALASVTVPEGGSPTAAPINTTSYRELLKAEHVALRRELLNNLRQLSRAAYSNQSFYGMGNSLDGDRGHDNVAVEPKTADPNERVGEWVRSSQEHVKEPVQASLFHDAMWNEDPEFDNDQAPDLGNDGGLMGSKSRRGTPTVARDDSGAHTGSIPHEIRDNTPGARSQGTSGYASRGHNPTETPSRPLDSNLPSQESSDPNTAPTPPTQQVASSHLPSHETLQADQPPNTAKATPPNHAGSSHAPPSNRVGTPHPFHHKPTDLLPIPKPATPTPPHKSREHSPPLPPIKYMHYRNPDHFVAMPANPPDHDAPPLDLSSITEPNFDFPIPGSNPHPPPVHQYETDRTKTAVLSSHRLSFDGMSPHRRDTPSGEMRTDILILPPSNDHVTNTDHLMIVNSLKPAQEATMLGNSILSEGRSEHRRFSKFQRTPRIKHASGGDHHDTNYSSDDSLTNASRFRSYSYTNVNRIKVFPTVAIIPQPTLEKFPDRIYKPKENYSHTNILPRTDSRLSNSVDYLHKDMNASIIRKHFSKSDELPKAKLMMQAEAQTNYVKNQKNQNYSKHKMPGVLRRQNMDQWVAKKVYFFVNGDEHTPKFEYRFRPYRDVKTLEALCDILSKRLKLSHGVRHIFTIDGELVESLDQFKNENFYVASSSKKFKVINRMPFDDKLKPSFKRSFKTPRINNGVEKSAFS